MATIAQILAAKKAKTSGASSLRTHLFCAFAQGKIDFENFRALAEFLEVYAYIIPSERSSCDWNLISFLCSGAKELLAREHANASRKVFMAYWIADIAETCLTEIEQGQAVLILQKQQPIAE